MVVYYVIALALYMQCSYREVLRCLLEGIQWLRDPSVAIRVAGTMGISQARTRLGWEPMRQVREELVVPVAISRTKGAWYGRWRLVSLDGSTLDVADEKLDGGSFRTPRSEPRFQRLSANSFRIAGRKRYPRAVRQPDG